MACKFSYALWIFLAILGLSALALCQSTQPENPVPQADEPLGVPIAQRHPQVIPPPQTPNAEDEAKIKMERDMAKKANEERHAALKRDTDKLLQLSTELKQYVDKSNQNLLSMEVVKKAEEIEKLAHSVKEKMKGNY